MYRFYLGLLDGQVPSDGELIDVKNFIEGKVVNREKILKNFVYKKQSDVYDFWTSKVY